MLLIQPKKILQARKVWDQAKKMAEIVYAFVMLYLAIDGGISAFHHVAEVMPKLKSALDATGHAGSIFALVADTAKAGDMSIESLKGVLTLVGQ
jgi:hypothetical protein